MCAIASSIAAAITVPLDGHIAVIMRDDLAANAAVPFQNGTDCGLSIVQGEAAHGLSPAARLLLHESEEM
jgi:hypothetical protein